MDSTKKGWRGDFLRDLEETGSVYHAASAAGVARSTVYKARDADEDFAEAWASAIDAARGSLEKSLLQRARDGSDHLLIHQGAVVKDDDGNPIVERKHETALAIFMAKKTMPEKYGDHAGDADSGAVVDLPALGDLEAVRSAEEAVLDAYNRGAISGARYDRLLKGLDARRKTLIGEDVERRLAEVEERLGADG